MQILFICSKESDYLQDLTYAGLAEILGKDSITDFPSRWQYHKERRYFWTQRSRYPKNLGLVSSLPQGSQASSSRTFSEVKDALRKNLFDLVLLASAKPDALNTLDQLFEWIKAPWIFIDGGDWSDVGGDFLRLGGQEALNLFRTLCIKKKPAVVFKREIPIGFENDSMFPLTFSINLSQVFLLPPLLPAEKKRYHVLFWAVESSPVRKELFKLLNGRYDCNLNGTVSGQTFRKYSLREKDYFRALNQAKIALSFRGEGFDTLRYWEVPACGSLLISEEPLIQIPNNFANKRHAVFCKNDLSDLLTLIDYYLAHEQESYELALEGQKHLLKYHTHLHRAEYLLDILRSNRVVRS